jgi:hypothetical protein
MNFIINFTKLSPPSCQSSHSITAMNRGDMQLLPGVQLCSGAAAAAAAAASL